MQFTEEGVGVECVLALVNLQSMEVSQVTVAMRPLGLTRPKYQEESELEIGFWEPWHKDHISSHKTGMTILLD